MVSIAKMAPRQTRPGTINRKISGLFVSKSIECNYYIHKAL